VSCELVLRAASEPPALLRHIRSLSAFLSMSEKIPKTLPRLQVDQSIRKQMQIDFLDLTRTEVACSKLGQHVCQTDIHLIQGMKILLILLMRIESERLTE